MGLRQLRAPGSRSSAARARRARSRRRSPTPPTVHRFTGLAPSVALHIPWDLVDDFAALRAYAEDLGVALGTINSNTFQDDDYKLGAPDPRRPEDPAEGDRPPLRVHRRHGRDRVARPQDLAGRGHQLPGPGRHARPPGPARRVRCATIYDRLGERPAAGARVQVLRAGVLPHRRARLGHVVRAGGRPRRPGRGLPRHRPPRAGHQHRVHRRPAAAAREARLVRLQQPLLRRRRPDRRRGRPVPAVPDPLRGASAAAASARTATSPSCSTSATTSRRRSPARSARCSTCRR